MRYEELVQAVKDSVKSAKVSKTVGHIAFQFNVEGEAEGAFYLEIDNGKINVEPYEYYDRNVIIVTSAEVIMQMIAGSINARGAYANGMLRAYGEVEQLELLPLGSECKTKTQKGIDEGEH